MRGCAVQVCPLALDNSDLQWIMDINSVEFYTIAFVVAMALIALIMGRSEKQPPSTYIVQLVTAAASGEEDDIVAERFQP